MLPGNSIVSFNVKYNEYYQTYNNVDTLSGSLANINLISNNDLIKGRMPENDNELVVDKLVITNMFKNEMAKNAGIVDIYSMLDMKIFIEDNLTFTIVGITDLSDPSIYVSSNRFNDILSIQNNYDYYYEESEIVSIENYNIYKENITLKKGYWPINDYEVIISDNNIDSIKLNSYLDEKVNDTKLKVVGFYHSQYEMNKYLTNENTVKYNNILKNDGLIIYTENKDKVIEYFKSFKLNIEDSYKNSKNKYISEMKDYIISSLVVAGIVLVISLIEIFLMLRSSFLSRIKEIGVLRAIGVKKSDIYKMFLGEIIAITTVASLPGIILSSYILNKLSNISYISNYILINPLVIILSIIFVYLFNVIIGLIPVFSISRKTPAQILSRHDLD